MDPFVYLDSFSYIRLRRILSDLTVFAQSILTALAMSSPPAAVVKLATVVATAGQVDVDACCGSMFPCGIAVFASMSDVE